MYHADAPSMDVFKLRRDGWRLQKKVDSMAHSCSEILNRLDGLDEFLSSATGAPEEEQEEEGPLQAVKAEQTSGVQGLLPGAAPPPWVVEPPDFLPPSPPCSNGYPPPEPPPSPIPGLNTPDHLRCLQERMTL
ncbi:unnamed protein product [Polarella glacialis]|nr:unnamed protein product [Polarella glacialis]